MNSKEETIYSRDQAILRFQRIHTKQHIIEKYLRSENTSQELVYDLYKIMHSYGESHELVVW